MNNIALGRYLPLHSLANKMDPRAKIAILFFLMIAIFIPAGFWGYIPIVLFILLALYASK
ncbi:MAG: energy-coupling factor transporter transmembrane protein EcfT, partial [Allobaculum sp.]|nr:energy-coupling factor transporter transmembrane protein EcfT [Allobaculum sp.]